MSLGGSQPDAVEGALACSIGHECFVFGGFSHSTFNQLRVFNSNKQTWRCLSPDYLQHPSLRDPDPKPRTAHSLCAYRDQVVVFGGSGAFMEDIRMRESFNDLWLWCTIKNKWRFVDAQGI